MTIQARDWEYANLPDDELAPTERQQALAALARAMNARDPQAAKDALLRLPQTSPPPQDPLSLAAAAIANAALNDEEPPQTALDAMQEWLAAETPLDGGPIAREPYEREWLIPGWIPASRVGLLTGAGGAGKTRIALQLANAIANGANWLGLNPTPSDPAAAVHASYEEELQEIGHRLNLIDPRPDANPVYGYDLTPSGPLWHFPYGSATGSLASAGERLRRACERVDAKLLIIDNLASAFGGNENDRAQVRSFMNAWDSWARKRRCAILMIGHPPKTRGFAKDEHGLTQIAELFSGSTDWINAARYAISIDNKTDEIGTVRHCLRFLKGNYVAEPPSPVWMSINAKGIWTPDARQTNPGANKTFNGADIDPADTAALYNIEPISRNAL